MKNLFFIVYKEMLCRWASLGPNVFYLPYFSQIFIYFLGDCTGLFKKCVKNPVFYGGLGVVASEKFVGPP